MDPLATNREDMSLERYIGIVVVLSLLLFVFSVAYFAEADGYKQSGVLEKTPQTFYMRGDLTAETEDSPYDGHVIGDYLIVVDTETVKVSATIDYSHTGIFEGWLLDLDSDKMLKIGIFDNNKLSSELTLEIHPYDLIIITEKLKSENGNKVDTPVGGALLEKVPKYQSCKCS